MAWLAGFKQESQDEETRGAASALIQLFSQNSPHRTPMQIDADAASFRHQAAASGSALDFQQPFNLSPPAANLLPPLRHLLGSPSPQRDTSTAPPTSSASALNTSRPAHQRRTAAMNAGPTQSSSAAMSLAAAQAQPHMLVCKPCIILPCLCIIWQP